jgi:hypothetical protein
MKELINSGVPEALRRLGFDLVARARQRQLLLEGHQLLKRIRKLVNGQRY